MNQQAPEDMQAAELARAPEAHQVLDVREQQEWEAGHLAGAHHVPLDQLPSRLAELDAGETVVVVCRSGRRSAAAAGLLNRQGFHARNLAGGMQALAKQGVVPRRPDGGAGTVA